MTTTSETTPDLFPTPRHVDGFDRTRRYDHTVVEVLDPTLSPQRYTIDIDDTGAFLRHGDDAGLRYGRQTIGQLRDRSGQLPRVHVLDGPDFAVRGFMLDISRDRIPTRQTLDRLVHVLETCRFNHLQLYVEHTFAYRDHETVWGEASPLDADDLVWLHDRCVAAGIELAANQNCFGHFGRWLSHDDYRQMAECPEGFELLPGVPFAPTTLAPTSENAHFAVALAREQVAAFGATTINIGCDETFELGHGVSSESVEARGRSVIYTEHLCRIIEPLVADGLTVQFWGDVIERDPQNLDMIPTSDTIALVWNYESPDTAQPDLPESITVPLTQIGIDITGDKHFAPRLSVFSEAGIRHWVVPGTSTWNTLIGRLDNAFGNLADAARAGRDSGAEGYMVTDWGDNGHQQPLIISYPAIAYGAAMSWSIDKNADLHDDIGRIIDRHLVGDDTGIIGGVLERVGRVASRTGVVAVNASPLFAALFPDTLILTEGTPDPEAMRDVITTLDEAAAALDAARPSGTQSDVIIEELAVAIDLARFAARTMGGSVGLEVQPVAERVAELDHLINRYRSAWLSSSRSGGLDDSTSHLIATRDLLLGGRHAQ